MKTSFLNEIFQLAGAVVASFSCSFDNTDNLVKVNHPTAPREDEQPFEDALKKTILTGVVVVTVTVPPEADSDYGSSLDDSSSVATDDDEGFFSNDDDSNDDDSNDDFSTAVEKKVTFRDDVIFKGACLDFETERDDDLSPEDLERLNRETAEKHDNDL